VSKVAKIAGKPRLRYRITFPYGGWADRSRRYRTIALARVYWPMAQDLEDKTRYQRYDEADIERWRKARLLNDRDMEQLGMTPGLKTLEQACDDYRRSWGHLSEGETKARWWAIRWLGDLFDPHIPMRNLRYTDGIRMVERLRAAGMKTTTIAKIIANLKRITRLQVANRTIEFNPFTDLSAGRVPQDERIAPVVLSAAEVGRILEAAKQSKYQWLHLFLLVTVGCGTRRKETLSLRWEMVDWEKRVLRLPGEITKTRKPRAVGIGQRLLYALLLERKDAGPIFPPLPLTTVSWICITHFAECGVKARLHDLRHTYATMIQSVGARPHEAMQRTGHSDMGILSKYSHAEVGEILEDRFEFMRVPEGTEAGA